MVTPLQKTERRSVAAYLVNAALFHVPAPKRAALLHGAGIDPACLQMAHSRVPAAAVTALWLSVTQALDDEFFAFDSRGLPRGAFAQICRSALHETQLGHALQQCLSGLNLFLGDITAYLQPRGDQVAIVLDCRITEPATYAGAQEIYLSMLMGLACWLVGRRVSITRTVFAYAQPSTSTDPMLWGAEAEYNGARTEILLEGALLKLPVVRNYGQLQQFLRRAPEDLVVRFRERSGLSAQLYRELKATPALNWPAQAQVAATLGLSDSAFRRRLEREGVSFQVIKHDVRKAMAFEALADGRLSIAEVAARCGFQEPSAFHRAFRQWTGVSPGRFRNEHVQAIETAHEVY